MRGYNDAAFGIPMPKDNEDFHGCDVLIGGLATITHRTPGHYHTLPTIRSHRDGIKVGCSFITTEALERIYQLHKAFTDQTDSKTHQ